MSGQEPKAETEERGSAFREFLEDAAGFGAAELRLTRDLIIRPRRVIDAYDAHGSTAGGLYPKPFRYYLTLNGLYLLLVALLGGYEQVLSRMFAPGALAAFAQRAGKSPDEFLADFDQWGSLLSVPLTTLVFVPPIFLLIRRWSPAGDRQDLRQTFTYLNAWTLYSIPLGLPQMLEPQYIDIVAPLTLLLWLVPYALMGRGRWWRTRLGAWIKGVVLFVVATLAMIPASAAVIAGGLAGAMLAP